MPATARQAVGRFPRASRAVARRLLRSREDVVRAAGLAFAVAQGSTPEDAVAARDAAVEVQVAAAEAGLIDLRRYGPVSGGEEVGNVGPPEPLPVVVPRAAEEPVAPAPLAAEEPAVAAPPAETPPTGDLPVVILDENNAVIQQVTSRVMGSLSRWASAVGRLIRTSVALPPPPSPRRARFRRVGSREATARVRAREAQVRAAAIAFAVAGGATREAAIAAREAAVAAQVAAAMAGTLDLSTYPTMEEIAAAEAAAEETADAESTAAEGADTEETEGEE